MAIIWIIFLVFMLISWWIGYTLKSKFKKYSKLPLNGNLTGKDVAEKMLRENGIYDVQVVSVQGELTDHYNPMKKTVNLSPEVFNGSGVSAAAVAAHECGHAIQHAKAYAWLQMRSALVPVVSFSSRILQWILLIGIFMVQTFPAILFLGILLFALTTLFSFITLPVEMDASKRAIAWLETSGITSPENKAKAQDALSWAAYTYVVAALASLATLIYYIAIFLGRRD